MIHSVLSDLVIYHSHKLFHNDIKPENVMVCNESYKLIDYGRILTYRDMKRLYTTKTEEEQPYGSDFNTSPMAMYIYKKSLKSFINTLPIATIHTRLYKYPFSITDLKQYLAFYETQVMDPYTRYIEGSKETREDLFETFAYTFDVCALGIMIAQIYFMRKQELPTKLLEFAGRLVNPEHPEFCSTASKALRLYEQMFG